MSNNILLDTTDKDTRPEIQHIAEHKKATLISKIRPYKGHKLFEVDIDNETIRVITPERTAVITSSSEVSTHNKIATRPNCLYISCLNRKNLKRLIDNAGGKDISHYEFIQ